MAGRILMIDDDERLTAMVEEYLAPAGLAVTPRPKPADDHEQDAGTREHQTQRRERHEHERREPAARQTTDRICEEERSSRAPGVDAVLSEPMDQERADRTSRPGSAADRRPAAVPIPVPASVPTTTTEPAAAVASANRPPPRVPAEQARFASSAFGA